MKVHAQRMLAVLGVTVISALVTLAGAQAGSRPDDRAGTLGVGTGSRAVVVPDAFERAVLRHPAPARPDDRAGARGVPSPAAAHAPAGSGTADSEFRWNGAAFGAAIALVIVVLGGAATLTMRRRSGAVAN
jgi:hypothetical protein